MPIHKIHINVESTLHQHRQPFLNIDSMLCANWDVQRTYTCIQLQRIHVHIHTDTHIETHTDTQAHTHTDTSGHEWV